MSMTPLWTSDEALVATGGELIGNPFVAHGVSIDTRTIEPGDLFVALPGVHADGHDFVAAAFARGAAAAVISRDLPDLAGPFLRVRDSQAALEGLGRHARARTSARILAVTGSVGKTSTKEALRLALGRGRLTHASAASYNNEIGVPLSLARMPAETAFGVFELGMNHAGELTALSRQVRPHLAMITNVEEAHRAHFNSVEDIADAKAEVFAGLEGDMIAILNRDNPHFDRLKAAAEAAGSRRIVTFGLDDAADAHAIRYALHEDCSCVTARIGDERMLYKVGAPGRHWVANSLAVLLAVQMLGGDLGLAALALADMMPVEGRGQRQQVTVSPNLSFWVVDESYNANPASMRAALDTLSNFNIETVEGRNGQATRIRGRRIAVLGDMRELGDAGPRLHAGLAQAIDDADVDLVLTVGELMRNLWDALPGHLKLAHAESAAEAVDLILAAVKANDVVMVKGSQSMGMIKVVNALVELGRAPAETSSKLVKG